MSTLIHKVATAGAALMLAGTAQAILIDDFDVDQSVSVLGGGSNSSSVAAGIGTSRTITVSNEAGQTQAVANLVTTSVLDLQNSVGAAGTVTVDWTGVANVDLTDSGASTGLFMSLPLPINNTLDVNFTVNGGSTFSTSYPDGSSGDDFFIPFSSFSNSGVFGNVTSITVEFTDGPGWDAAIDFIETRPETIVPVPVPGTLALLGLGLAGLGIRRGKRS